MTSVAAVRQPSHVFTGWQAFSEGAVREGWSDGLPLVPPTSDLVAAFVDSTGLAPETIVGEIPTRDLEISVEQIATNAVMAGCRIEYMPLVLAATRAFLHPLANPHCVAATLAGASQLVIVNGPARNELGIRCRDGAFGPGSRANATIGRAIRLIVRNCARSIPGEADRAAFSTPARFTFCIGEDEDASDWIPMHVERGFAPSQSVVTLNSMTDAYGLFDDSSSNPEAFLDRLAHLCRCRPVNTDEYLGDARTMLLVIGPEHRRVLRDAGWSKADVRRYLYPLVTAPHTRPNVVDRHGFHAPGGPTESSVELSKPESLLIVTAGGDGSNVSWTMFPHLASAISMPAEPLQNMS
jgi:hypothetical protein